MIWIFLTFLAMGADEVEAPEITLQELIPQASQRHISTVVESRITRQFTEVPQIAECVEQFKVTKEMVEDPNRQNDVKQKQLQSSNCVRDKLATVSDDDLEKLSNELGLKQHSLIKGTGPRAITDYLATRFKNAFYVKDKNNRDVPLVLDQKMFFDLYESQLGKSVLLDISNFCYNHLTLKGSATGISKKDVFNKLIGYNGTPKGTIDDFTDSGSPRQQSSSSTNSQNSSQGNQDDPNKLYEDFLTEVVDLQPNAIPTATQQDRMKNIYTQCGMLIRPLCEVYEACNCYYRSKTSSSQVTCTGANAITNDSDYNRKCLNSVTTQTGASPNTGVSNPQLQAPDRGTVACHIAGRMRSHRANLAAVNKQQDLLNDSSIYRTEDNKGYKVNLDKGPKTYTGGAQSIDDLTSLNSAEIDNIAKQKDFDENCEQNPDDETCKDFVFSSDEVVKFNNTVASYSAATEIEVRRIRKLGTSSEDELKKILESKGYVDLLDELNGKGTNPPRSSAEIVNEAINRFEAQREATFAEMSKAFERNQIAGKQNKNAEITRIKEDYKNRPNEFKQLMLFNNVVSGFLDIEKKNENGDFETVGKNVRGLQKEAQNNSLLEGLSQLGGDSSLGNNDSPIVDRGFIGQILGEDVEP